jgi:phospholipid transport system substrate-binding protein
MFYRRAVITRFALTAMLGLVALSAPGTVRAEEGTETASRLIRSLGDQAILVLSDKNAGSKDRQQKFQTLFAESFDVPTIARFTLGRYWRTATPEQQEQFISLFKEMVVNTYANRFSEYSGETLSVTGARMESDTLALVTSQIVRPGGAQPARVDWRVAVPQGGAVRIVDVVVEGVSMSVTQQQEFASVIQRNGGQVDALLQAMRERIAKS